MLENGHSWRIEGLGKGRVRIGYAQEENGRLVLTLEDLLSKISVMHCISRQRRDDLPQDRKFPEERLAITSADPENRRFMRVLPGKKVCRMRHFRKHIERI